MQLSDEDMKALSFLDVNDLPITDAQKKAIGKICQGVRQFLGRMQQEGAEPEGKGFNPKVIK